MFYFELMTVFPSKLSSCFLSLLISDMLQKLYAFRTMGVLRADKF